MKTVYTPIDTEEILKKLSKELNEERYIHSAASAITAEKLAEKFNLNPQKAYIAGLLHDCAKCFDIKRMTDIADKYLPDVDEAEKNNTKALHAPVSAYIAKSEYKVEDTEILSAIRFHTIGKCNMSDFEKIIYLADKIEPETRPFEYRNPIAECIFTENSLNKAMLKSYEFTVISLVERKLPIYVKTIDVYNEMLKQTL